MTVDDVKRRFAQELAGHGDLVSYSDPPSVETLFSLAELRDMAADPALLEGALQDLRAYREDYFWDGRVRDSRNACVGGKHDVEGTRRTFQQFRVS